jgi:hypothetical protein
MGINLFRDFEWAGHFVKVSKRVSGLSANARLLYSRVRISSFTQFKATN